MAAPDLSSYGEPVRGVDLSEYGTPVPTDAKPVEGGLLNALGRTVMGGARQTGRALGATIDVLQHDNADLAAASRAQQADAKDPRLQGFLDSIAAWKQKVAGEGREPGWLESAGAVAGAVKDNPMGALLMIPEQLPNSAVVLGGGYAGLTAGSLLAGPVGGVVGGLAGMFAGNAAVETGGKGLERAAKGALTDQDFKDTLQEGAIKGAVVTGVDALTLGLSKPLVSAGRRAAEKATEKVLSDAGVDITSKAATEAALLNPKLVSAVQEAQAVAIKATQTVGSRVLRGGGALALETFGEGLGEYLGEYAATGRGDKVDAIVEAFSSLGQSAGELAYVGAKGVVMPSPKPAIADAETFQEAHDAFKFDVESTRPTIDLNELAKSYKDHTPEDLVAQQEELLKAVSGNVEYARSEDGTHTFNGAPLKVVAAQDLPLEGEGLTRHQYEAISALNEARGKRTIVYANDARLPDGMAQQPDVAFISSHTTFDPVVVAEHEVEHLSEEGEKQATFAKIVQEELTAQAEALAIRRHGKLDSARLAQEIRADIAGDAMADPTFHTRVIQKMTEQLGEKAAESHAQAFLESLKGLIDRIKAILTGKTFTSPDGQQLAAQYVKNLERVHDALAAAMADQFITKGYRPPGAQTNTSQHLLARALEQQKLIVAAAEATGPEAVYLRNEAARLKPVVAPEGSSAALVSALAAAQKAPFDRTTEERLNIDAIKAGVRMSPKARVQMRESFLKEQSDADRKAGYKRPFKNPVRFKDGSRISGFSDPGERTTFYGYDKNGELFSQRALTLKPEDFDGAVSNDSNRTAEDLRQSIMHLRAQHGMKASPKSRPTDKQFAEVQKAQRYGGPEDLATKLGPPGKPNLVAEASGKFQRMAEHIGDLVHRAAMPSVGGEGVNGGGHEYGLQALLEKAERALRQFADTKDFIPQARRNFEFQIEEGTPGYVGKTVDELVAEFLAASQKYADAYRAIPVLTEMQELGRDAAVALGEHNYPALKRNLEALVKLASSTDAADRYHELKFSPKVDKAEGKADKVATPADFTRENVKGILGRKDWVILTAENPAGRALNDIENAQRMKELREYLLKQGLKSEPVKGKYGGNEEHSRIVFGVDRAKAIEIGKHFGQESVLTRDGLVYQDGSINPAQDVTVHETPPEDFYSTLKDGSTFSVGIDFDTKIGLTEAKTGHPKRVSTRLPTAVKATENPLTEALHVGLASMKMDPQAFAKNVSLVSRYVNFPKNVLTRSVEKRAEVFIDELVKNLLWLYDQVPAAVRERSKLWYVGANAISARWSKRFKLDDHQIAAVIAVLSPQKDWFTNVSLGERVLDIYTTKANHVWDGAMTKAAARIFAKDQYAVDVALAAGKSLSELATPDLKALWIRAYDEAHNTSHYRVVTPEGEFVGWATNLDGQTRAAAAWGSLATIAKAVSVIEDGALANVSKQLGSQHKVRSFYNNILDPNSARGEVTIDTHAVAAALLRPLSGGSEEVLHNFGGGGAASSSIFGSKGTYGLYAEAYRRSAEQRGILPREMQSITWEAVRGLFTASFKAQQKNVDAVDSTWKKFRNGEATLDETRKQILELSGGITNPTWVRSDGRSTEAEQDSSYAGELPELRVPRGGSRSAVGGGVGDRAGSSVSGGVDDGQQTRSDARGRGPARASPKASLLPAHGTSRADGVDVVGTHYSGAERSSLASSSYGTGAKGAEYARVQRSSDDRLKQRVYFYLDTGNGTYPEKYVGNVAHGARLNGLYDIAHDPLDLYLRAHEANLANADDRMNAFESALLDAGFDGYFTREFGGQGAAVLVGQRRVDVLPVFEQIGEVVSPMAPFTGAKLRAREIMADRSLPAGVSGERWMKLVPGVKLDADRLYYKDEVARAVMAQKPELKASPKQTFGRHIAPLAMRAYESLGPEARMAVDSWNVNWDKGALEGAFARDTAVADDIRRAFAPVRAKLRELYGDTVPLYRGEREWKGQGDPDRTDRVLFSWSPVQSLAQSFARNTRFTRRPILDSEIDTAVAAYEEKGYVKFRGYSYIRSKTNPAYYNIYDRDRQNITDGDDLRRDLTSEQRDIAEITAESLRGAKAYRAEVPVDRLVWVPVGANLRDPEIIAEYNPRVDAAVELKASPKQDAAIFDPDETEAKALEAAIEGKTVVQATKHLIANGTPDQKAIAERVLAQIQKLESKGVKFELHTAHVGDTVPRTLLGSRGLTIWRFAKGDTPATVDVWLNGADVVGKVGMSNRTLLHELVHAATTGIIHAGNMKDAATLRGAQHVNDLFTVSNAVVRHFNKRVRDANAGRTELTEFEQQMFNRQNNAFRDPHETLAWALTDADAQAYLESIPYEEHHSMWTAFVDAIRKVLGLPARLGTALSEVLRVGENLLGDNVNEIVDVLAADGSGATAIQSQVGTVINTAAKFSPKIVGASNRTYTPGQRRMFQNTGRMVNPPTLAEKVAAMRKDLGKKLAQGIVDQFAPLKELSPMAYMLARLSKGTAGAFEAMLHHGKLSIKDGAYDSDRSGGFVEKVGIPLQGEMEDFLWWVAANRAERLTAQDRERLFSKSDIAAGKSLADGNLTFDYTLANGQTTRSRKAAYEDSLKKFDGFAKNALDMAEQSGLIDPVARKIWEHEFYVPFYRVSEEDGAFIGGNIGNGLVRQRAFKKLKGGTDKLNSDLLANTLANWAHLLDAGAKNRAAKSALEAAAQMGVAVEADAATVKAMGQSIGKKNSTVWFSENGVPRHFLVDDPFVLTAITSLEYAGMKGPLMDAMSTFKHWLTVGVTANPAFKVKNLIRDSVQAIATSDIGYNPVTNTLQGIKASDRDSQNYVSALASGGLIRFGTMLEGRQADRVRQLVKMGVKDTTILNNDSKLQAMYDKYLEPAVIAYNELGNRSEEITRSALFEQLKAKGMDHATAALMARDLMDFSLQGSWTGIRFLTQVVPFMNARLQGMYKLGRAAQEDPKRMAAVIGATALFSLALLAAYGGDDDWKKREDWDRDNFWWFKLGGVAFRIPKPFEIGAIATLAERGVEYFTDPEMTGKRLNDRVLALLSQNLSMNPVPQLVKPILDVYANKSSFTGRPIETLGMERLAPDYRFTSSTSMLARGASTAGQAVTSTVGANFLSPVQIDSMLRGYFSWLGTFVVGASDLVARPLSGEPTRPAGDMWKTATGGMLAELPEGQSRYVSHVYDQAKIVEQAWGTFQSLRKEGKAAEAAEYLDKHRAEIAQYKTIEQVKKAESKLNERIRLIERSTYSPDVKKEMIARINVQKDQIARHVK